MPVFRIPVQRPPQAPHIAPLAGGVSGTVVTTSITMRAAFIATIDTNATMAAAFRLLYADTNATMAAAFRLLYADTNATMAAAFSKTQYLTLSTTMAAAFATIDQTITQPSFPVYHDQRDVELRLVHPTGYYLWPIDTYVSVDYTLVTNDVGKLTLTLPGTFPIELIGADYRIEVWLMIDGNSRLEGDTQFLIQTITTNVDDDGTRTYTVDAYSLNHLLKRRAVAYAPGTVGYAYLIDQIDDMLKILFKQNYTASALNTARNLAAYLSCDPEIGIRASSEIEVGQKTLLDAMKDIANYAAQIGTPLFFDIVALDPPGGLTFRVFYTCRGNDRRSATGASLVLSQENATIGAYTVVEDYESEVTYVYALGPGEGDIQMLSEQEDTGRSNRSPFGRKEIVISAQNVDTQDALDTFAKAQLYQNRPRKIFSGKINDVPGSRYGKHWGHGDYVTIDAEQSLFDCFLSVIHVTITKDGWTIDAAARSDT